MKNEDHLSIKKKDKKNPKKQQHNYDHDIKILNQYYTNSILPEVFFKS